MPLLKDYRLFISHAWKYGTDYDALISLLDKAPLFSYHNYSAPQEKPLFPPGTPMTNKDIAQKIQDKIKPAQIVLVLSGMYTAHSDWMKYEIDVAKSMNKPIIGIRTWGQERVPSYVQDNATIMVHWQTISIISAIRNYA